jgi:Flp pilus assembly protein protease CpaA
MNQIIIFFVGLAFLAIFSYRDIKYCKIENRLILIYLFLTLGILIITGNIFSQLFLCLFWTLFGGLLWKLNNIGGADLKILMINSIYISLLVPNIVAGHFMFIILFGFHGLAYGIFAKIIKTKKEIPFVPIITMTYIINYIFWIL